MQKTAAADTLGNVIFTHPLDSVDAAILTALRSKAPSNKGMRQGIEARGQFNAMMESVMPRSGVTFTSDTIGGVSGLWVQPPEWKPDEAILHLHGGWFNFGSARAFRHLVAHIASRAKARAFIPEYRLAPEHPFPAAPDDVMECYQGLACRGVRKIALTGDSAGGNLALGLASRINDEAITPSATLVGVAVLSPVTDLTLSGESYETRAKADPLFTRPQVAELVTTYLGKASANHPLASPLFAEFSEMPPIRIHVGDDEVLLDDSRGFVERAFAAGVDAQLDVWMGMAHGFAGSVGELHAAGLALDSIGTFLAKRWRATTN